MCWQKYVRMDMSKVFSWSTVPFSSFWVLCRLLVHWKPNEWQCNLILTINHHDLLEYYLLFDHRHCLLLLPAFLLQLCSVLTVPVLPPREPCLVPLHDHTGLNMTYWMAFFEHFTQFGNTFFSNCHLKSTINYQPIQIFALNCPWSGRTPRLTNLEWLRSLAKNLN